jgi:hypothetical protein
MFTDKKTTTMKNLMFAMLFATIFLSSCKHYYYVPNVQNVPLFREKDEWRFSGDIGVGTSGSDSWGDQTTCIDLQAAYSLTDRIGVMLNYMSAKNETNSGNSYGKGSYIEGAVGYYKPVGPFGVFEVYGGVGVSGQEHQYEGWGYNYNSNTPSSQISGTSDLSFVKLFVQPSYGLTFNLFEIALSTRIYSLSFYNIQNYFTGDDDLRNQLSALSTKNHIFLEPAITLRGGWETVKIQFQYVYASYLNNPSLDLFEKTHVSVGLYISLAAKPRKKMPKEP